MPRVGQGNEAVNFPYDAEGIKAAEKYAQAVGGQVDYSEQASDAPGMRSNISLGYEEGGKIPVNNGATRSVQTYAGGGKTGYNIMNRYEEGGKVEKKTPRKKKGSQLIQNDALKSIQDAQAKLNQDLIDGKFGSRKDGDWDQAAFKAAEKVIGDRLAAHKANPNNWAVPVKKKAEGGKVNKTKDSNKGITGVYDAVLTEGGYKTEVEKQKARELVKSFMEEMRKVGLKAKKKKAEGGKITPKTEAYIEPRGKMQKCLKLKIEEEVSSNNNENLLLQRLWR